MDIHHYNYSTSHRVTTTVRKTDIHLHAPAIPPSWMIPHLGGRRNTAGRPATSAWRSAWTVVLAVVGVIVIGLFALTATAFAQDTQPPVQQVTADDVNAVARELWCPLCSGVRLDGCELKACDQMKEVIQIKLEEGQDKESIKQYFVEQYGPQVLGEPPKEGFNLLAWILPILVVVGGGVYLVRQGRRMLRPTTGPAMAPAQENSSGNGELEQKLEEELDRYA